MQFEPGDKVKLLETISSHRKGIVYGNAGELAKVISTHHLPVLLVQLGNRKFSVNQNKVEMVRMQVIGHIGADAVINNVNGRSVINFSVAHSNSYINNEGQQVSNTLWVSCALWRDNTSIAQYLLKGTEVYVDGVPSVDMYRNSTGDHVPVQRMRVDNIQLLGKKQS